MISDWLSVSLKDRYVLPGRREGVPGSFVGEGILPLLERPRIWFIYQRNWFSLPGVLFFSRFIAPPREEYHAPSWFPDENSKCARLRVSIIEGGCAYMKCDKWWWPRAAPSTGRRLVPHLLSPISFWPFHRTDFEFSRVSLPLGEKIGQNSSSIQLEFTRDTEFSLTTPKPIRRRTVNSRDPLLIITT